ncbi:uncharacterized protein LOC143580574 [Bidens hawaiensis]|uniref:uncharacterized protein LOC143580574 n=1 Tax=Bidens hawaiensis TaxID=980011 RepID=UPI00404917D9
MVVALGPGKFYGSRLPRPRIYTDIKFYSERVDPPVSVIDPLMSWAEEAHWSMGGLSFNRHRLQGRIEGSVDKLRNQIEKSFMEKESLSPKLKKKQVVSKSVEKTKSKKKQESLSPSPPPAPLANKRKRRYIEEEGEEPSAARKLADEFELVAKGLEVEGVVEEPLKSLSKAKKLRKVGEPRVSPRLAKGGR